MVCLVPWCRIRDCGRKCEETKKVLSQPREDYSIEAAFGRVGRRMRNKIKECGRFKYDVLHCFVVRQ
jgi:hypothetical protein